MGKDFDIFIIGGGINGCGIARDAAGRGYKVGLAEMNDLASGTSSGTSKLIHGGFRYLEHYEFRLVREALSEREVLLEMAPHVIWPIRFVLPHHKDMRPAWLLRLGLFLYDHIGKRKLLPGTRIVDLRTAAVGKPLRPVFLRGFEYSDCSVDDARLVILNARDAADRGASLATRTKVVNARRTNGLWHVETHDLLTTERNHITARLLVNAAGPWVDKVLGETIGCKRAKNVRLVQGSHVVVPALYDHDRAYIFQNGDGRIIFAIPYARDFTLIGTTDRDFEGDAADVRIGADETAYLCQAASEYFLKPVEQEDIVWSYSRVRPLYDDGAPAAQEATRDYVVRVEGGKGEAALINIFGGKITTYRRLAEAVLQRVEALLGAKHPAWTARSRLPGGDFPIGGYESTVTALLRDYPFLGRNLAGRLVRSYGTRAWVLLGAASSVEELGTQFGATLTEREVRHLIEHEWALTAEDIVWRRSKLGLHMIEQEVAHLNRWMKESA